MTTIIAIEHPTGVTLGYDSLVSYGGRGTDLEQPKVFANGQVVFGVAGALLDANILRYAELPVLADNDWDVDKWVTTKLIPAITAALAKANASTVSNGKVETGNSTLAIVRGRVYEISFDTCWTREVSKRYAIGSGSPYALGALAAGATMREALGVAADLDKSTGGRLTVTQASAILKGEAA